MNLVVHRADTRGGAEHGWLSTRHSFSFANWYEPTRMGFGALRVLNDDVIAPRTGFDMHAHSDFEIITIVEEGMVTHEDSMGTKATVSAGEVQVMSAGTGVVHGEWNREEVPLALFQLWIEPDEKGVTPRYDQKTFGDETLSLLVSKNGEEGSLQIHQDARIYRARLEEGMSLTHEILPGKGVYLFLIDGSLEAQGVLLASRDALGVSDAEDLTVVAKAPSRFLMIEVPMR